VLPIKKRLRLLFTVPSFTIFLLKKFLGNQE
jgi:hypothetical protein